MRIIHMLGQFFKGTFGEGQTLLAQEPSKLLVLSGSVVVISLAVAAALNAALVLIAALGVIYFLASQVLGVKMEFDPRTLMQQAQRYATAQSAPN